jgi:alkyl hydroperoxide reductase subunit F
MLDSSLLEQLKSVFAQLESEIDLVLEESNHPDQGELEQMLKQVASTSSKISLIKSTNNFVIGKTPQFHIQKNKKPTGIIFKAIPGGHEFTSLILGILNADGKGKLPEEFLQNRIRRLKKNIGLKTYMSLSCENCPDVVQSLNQIALIHGSFQHEIIDGAYAQDEIDALSIQGVPSLVVDSKMVHSGRIQMLDLVAKLEQVFGIDEATSVKDTVNKNLGHFDVVVVGGGPAGASAAIYSVRKGLRTALLTDKIGGQVQETKGIENLISVTYTEGPRLAAQLSEHVASYPVKVFENRRVKSVSKDAIKSIELESGENLTTNSIIVSTGAKWRELGVPGEKEYMGRGVAYCPHCDGPFYKEKKVAVIGGGNSGVEAAIDLAGIVAEVVLFEYQDKLKADQVLVDKLKTMPNVSIITSARAQSILGDGSKVVALEYEDRLSQKINRLNLDGIFIQIGLIPNSSFLRDTVELTKFGEIVVDNKGRTSVPGIYAAGDVTTTPYKQIIIAMGEGAKAALAAFEDRMYQQVST